jgi:acyl-[acyl-carrier-protein] desaturase
MVLDIGTGKRSLQELLSIPSFQELATYVSHNRVSQLAKSYGDKKLAKNVQDDCW